MSKAVEITVSLKDSRPTPPTLKLRDSEGGSSKGDDLTTSVYPEATVTWIPDYSSGISQLVSITKNTKITKDNYDLMLSEGKGQPNGTYDVNIIDPSPGKGKTEYYLIGFKIDGDDTTYYSDPKLIMKT